MTLADFTSPGLMIPRLCGRDAATVIEELSESLHREQRLPDLVSFVSAVWNRERLASTEMEAGIAFPHARLPGLPGLSFALGRPAEPLAWTPHTARSVRLVFLMAVPADDCREYLPLISGLARVTKDSRLMDLLRAASDTFQMLQALQQVAFPATSFSVAR